MPPKLVEQAVNRLYGLSGLLVVCTLLIATFLNLVQPEFRDIQRNDPIVRLTQLVVVLIAGGMLALHHFHVLPARTLLAVGMAFEVAIAFGIAMLETASPFDPAQPVRGVPWVAIWVLAVSLLIPKRPLWTVIIALVAASMWPLAYEINLWRHDRPPLPWSRLSVWLVYLYVVAGLAAAAGTRAFGREIAALRADDLGSYHLTALIGQGGMGEVWRATHKMLAREAAVKIVRSDLIAGMSAHDADIAIRRFEREARATASLQSPNTVFLYDFGTAKDGSFYYVMELLDGINLQRLITSFGPQPACRVVHVLRDMCRSLDEAHRRELVHRDLKPSNVMLCQVALEHDVIKVLDFGLVKPTGRGDQELTADGISGGTPAYIAPEVALGDRNIDGRADIYAMGCIAYFMLTSQLVFDEPTPTAMSIAHVQKPAPPPSTRSELSIPPALERIVLQCLEKKPSDRPQGARELAGMLDAIDVESWTAARAQAWWQAHLPETSTLRTCNYAERRTPTLVQVA